MRQPKPFFRKYTKTWYVQIGKQQINLGKDEELAFAKYHELMAGRGRAQFCYRSVPEVFDAYLSWIQENRSDGTYKKALHYLNLCAKHLGPGFPIARLEPIVVTQWVEAHRTWTPSTCNDAISMVQRAFNWAVKRGHLVASPVAVVPDKPTPTRRETVFTRSEWEETRSHISDQEFGDFVDFMWLTGCRPLEARTVCAHHIDVENQMIVFPRSEAKGKKNERVIFLPDSALEICKRRIAEISDGPIFRNTRGRPWTKDSINCRFRRLKEKLGRSMCAYAIRHSYATQGLKEGVDSLTLAQLMGHADTSMLAKHYAHLARNPSYLKEQARRFRN